MPGEARRRDAIAFAPEGPATTIEVSLVTEPTTLAPAATAAAVASSFGIEGIMNMIVLPSRDPLAPLAPPAGAAVAVSFSFDFFSFGFFSIVFFGGMAMSCCRRRGREASQRERVVVNAYALRVRVVVGPLRRAWTSRVGAQFDGVGW